MSRRVIELLGSALASQPRASFAVSGGSTAKLVFAARRKPTSTGAPCSGAFSGRQRRPVKVVLEGRYDPMRYPAQITTYEGEGAMWFLDKAAARLIG